MLVIILMLNPSFKVPVLNIVGEFSPILEETIALNGKLNPAATNWLKLLVRARIIIGSVIHGRDEK